MTILNGWAVRLVNEKDSFTFILLGDFPSQEQIQQCVTVLKLAGAWKLESVQQAVPVVEVSC